MLKQLVYAFDGDGLPFAVYDATLGLIEAILGKPSTEVFADAIDSCDDGFYLSNGEEMDKVWEAMVAASVEQDPVISRRMILQ